MDKNQWACELLEKHTHSKAKRRNDPLIHEQNLVAATFTALPSKLKIKTHCIDKLCNETSNKIEALKQVAETKHN